LPTTIIIRPLASAASIEGAVPASATTIAGTKPACCAPGPAGSGRNERRHVTSNERDMPWRLAVEDIARGVCRLSMTIRSFSSSDQRRRRPVSMTSSRSTLVLCLWLSISTVTHHSTEPNKAAPAEGRLRIAPIGKLFEKAAVAKHPCLIERLSSANLSQLGVAAVGEGPILRIGENDETPPG
jgi:hypothetical protein